MQTRAPLPRAAAPAPAPLAAAVEAIVPTLREVEMASPVDLGAAGAADRSGAGPHASAGRPVSAGNAGGAETGTAADHAAGDTVASGGAVGGPRAGPVRHRGHRPGLQPDDPASVEPRSPHHLRGGHSSCASRGGCPPLTVSETFCFVLERQRLNLAGAHGLAQPGQAIASGLISAGLRDSTQLNSAEPWCRRAE